MFVFLSFVYVVGQYHVGGASQQCYSPVMAGLACVVCMWCSWSHTPMSSSTLLLKSEGECSRARALTDS